MKRMQPLPKGKPAWLSCDHELKPLQQSLKATHSEAYQALGRTIYANWTPLCSRRLRDFQLHAWGYRFLVSFCRIPIEQNLL